MYDFLRAAQGKTNTVWVGLDNIYGNTLSHKKTWFTIQWRFSQKPKSYKMVFQPLDNFYEKG